MGLAGVPAPLSRERAKTEVAMLRFEKMTVKAQEAVQSAQEVAARHENQQIEPVHLLAALVTQADGVVPPLLARWAGPTKRWPKRLSGGSDAWQKWKGLPSNTWGVR